MDLVKSVKVGWKWLAKTINGLIDGVNARTLIQGDKMLFRETPSGVLISADIPAIQALIDKTVAAAVAANPPGGGTGGGGSGGGGTSGFPGTGGGGGGPDQSGTGDGLGWDANSPINAGNGVTIYPAQFDLPNSMTSFTLTRSWNGGLNADSISVGPSGVSGTFNARNNGPPGFTPFLGPYTFTITYPGGVLGPQSPAFTMPSGGGTVVLGGHAFFIPNP